MLTREENELLTGVGPGTPGGNMLRRYWQPALLSEELPPSASPKAVRLLGEDLVLFRDDQGRPGMLGLNCPHRGADLSYGRVEDGGLRCIYHGWLFDIQGRCLDQPGEKGEEGNRDSFRHKAYACREAGGFIFTYMGPGEPPCLPAYENITASSDHRFIRKYFQECNYLQGNEGNIDPAHLSFLHGQFDEQPWSTRDLQLPIPGSETSSMTLYKQDRVPTIEVEITDFGVRIMTARRSGPDRYYLRVSNFVMPNLCAVPGPMGPDGYNMNWHVPIDDTHHWKYMITFRRSGPLELDRMRKSFESDIKSDYRLIRNLRNRYLQDRDEMSDRTYSGMGPSFVVHDAYATESQGSIQDRTQEHLGSTDIAIVAARKLLLKAVADVQGKGEPLHVVREPKSNRFPHLWVTSEVIPSNVDVKDYVRQVIQVN